MFGGSERRARARVRANAEQHTPTAAAITPYCSTAYGRARRLCIHRTLVTQTRARAHERSVSGAPPVTPRQVMLCMEKAVGEEDEEGECRLEGERNEPSGGDMASETAWRGDGPLLRICRLEIKGKER